MTIDDDRVQLGIGENGVGITYRYDAAENTVTTSPTGALAIDEIRAYFMKVGRDPAVGEGFVEIVHFDNVTDFAFNYSGARDLVDVYRRCLIGDKRCRGSVILARTPLGYGIARMLAFITSEYADFRVVRNEEDLRREVESLKRREPR